MCEYGTIQIELSEEDRHDLMQEYLKLSLYDESFTILKDSIQSFGKYNPAMNEIYLQCVLNDVLISKIKLAINGFNYD